MNRNIIIQALLAAVVAFLGSREAIGRALPPVTGAQQPLDQVSSPTPTFDPMATPVLPENPTQIDLGRFSYFFNCMPCHGDIGQGLTDAFRQTWVEDHQNCWGRGCHAGRQMDEGFPLPTIIPAVISDTDALQNFHAFDELYNYLRTTHPPQRPGKLSDDDYRALTAFLWVENGKSASEIPAGPIATGEPTASEAAASRTPTETTRATETPSPAVTAQGVAALPVEAASATATAPEVAITQSAAPQSGLIGAIILVVFAGAVLLIWRNRRRAS
jgi:hypothetical protein